MAPGGSYERRSRCVWTGLRPGRSRRRGMGSFADTRFEASLYQCSACRYTSFVKTHVTTHIRHKCPTARALSEKRALFSRPLSEKGLAAAAGCRHNTIEGDHNVQDNSTTINLFPLVYVGSQEERRRLFDIFNDPEAVRELTNREPEEIPAALFRMWKGVDAPPDMKNIEVVGNCVKERRGQGRVVSVPRAKFVKKTVGDMFEAVVAVQPTNTADPCSVEKIHNDLHRKELRLGKKHQVSRIDAVKMHVTGSREAYNLGTDARQFLNHTSALVDTELNEV